MKEYILFRLEKYSVYLFAVNMIYGANFIFVLDPESYYLRSVQLISDHLRNIIKKKGCWISFTFPFSVFPFEIYPLIYCIFIAFKADKPLLKLI